MAKKIIYKEQIAEIIRLVKKNNQTGDQDFYRLALHKAEDINRNQGISYASDFFLVNLVKIVLQFHKTTDELYRMLELLGITVISMDEAAKAVA